MSSWDRRVQVIKGKYGEEIVRKHFEDLGWIVYEPKTDGPHAFDKLCVKDKEHIIIIEVKTKASMNNWYATGFNIRQFNEYINIVDKYKIEMVVFFVDEKLKKIYGNNLSVLRKPYKASDGMYPWYLNNRQILFSVECMETIRILSDEDVTFLKDHSTRNYGY